MFGANVYVHSNMDNANLTVSFDSFDHPEDKAHSISVTINKLNGIANDLDNMAEAFLQGYSIEAAQQEADQANELLVQLANRVLYGADAYEMAKTLTRNQTVKGKALKQSLQNQDSQLARAILDFIGQRSQVGISELTTFIINTLSGGQTTIEVSEAGAHIVELGKLFDVNTINTTLRKGGEAILTDNIFKSSKELITGRKGVFRSMIKDLIKSSKYGTVQNAKQAIDNFCNKLNKKMKEQAKQEVPFMWTADTNKLERIIDDFTEQLKPQLKQSLSDKKILEISNTVGAIGEEVRESISKTANSVIISLQVGDMSEDQLIDQMEHELKTFGSQGKLSKMLSFHEDGKQSQTDLILLNTKTKAIARAQSKNHFVSYFTNNKTATNQIDNFRWQVENSVNLLNFVNKLSTLNIGTGLELNETDFSNIGEAIANNLWAKNVGSHYSADGTIKRDSVSVGDFQNELEGCMEKLLAGQVTSLLGVSLQPVGENIQVIDNASNIFYVLNGRMKKTADLVREVIQQLEESQFQSLTSNINRSIIVTLTGMNLEGVNTAGFLVNKLKAYPNGGEIQSIGTSMGAQILNQVGIKVTLGTSIGVINNSSLLI